MSYKPEPAMWSHDTGKQIPCFDNRPLIIVWVFNIKGKPRLYVCKPIFGSLAPFFTLANSVFVAVVVVHMRPRAIPLAMITMRKSTHGFPFLSHMTMELRLVALRNAAAPL